MVLKAFGAQVADTALTGLAIGQVAGTQALGGFGRATQSLLGAGLLGRTADRFKLL